MGNAYTPTASTVTPAYGVEVVHTPWCAAEWAPQTEQVRSAQCVSGGLLRGVMLQLPCRSQNAESDHPGSLPAGVMYQCVMMYIVLC